MLKCFLIFIFPLKMYEDSSCSTTLQALSIVLKSNLSIFLLWIVSLRSFFFKLKMASFHVLFCCLKPEIFNSSTTYLCINQNYWILVSSVDIESNYSVCRKVILFHWLERTHAVIKICLKNLLYLFEPGLSKWWLRSLSWNWFWTLSARL